MWGGGTRTSKKESGANSIDVIGAVWEEVIVDRGYGYVHVHVHGQTEEVGGAKGRFRGYGYVHVHVHGMPEEIGGAEQRQRVRSRARSGARARDSIQISRGLGAHKGVEP